MHDHFVNTTAMLSDARTMGSTARVSNAPHLELCGQASNTMLHPTAADLDATRPLVIASRYEYC